MGELGSRCQSLLGPVHVQIEESQSVVVSIKRSYESINQFLIVFWATYIHCQKGREESEIKRASKKCDGESGTTTKKENIRYSKK